MVRHVIDPRPASQKQALGLPIVAPYCGASVDRQPWAAEYPSDVGCVDCLRLMVDWAKKHYPDEALAWRLALLRREDGIG